MNLIELKNHIHANNLIGNVLDKLGCKQIKAEQGNRIITASLPGGDNPRSVQVKNNPFLDASIRSKNINKIDIFDVVSFIYFGEINKKGMKYSREMAINWVKKRLDITNDDISTESFKWAYDITKKTTKNIVLNENILDSFIPYPHREWINDGINYNTQVDFGIKYNLLENQIVFPVYNDENELIGIKARNLNYKKDKDMPKYIYLQPFFVGGNLFGLNVAKENIKKQNNNVIIFEAEKSVMKAYQYGHKNTVALACKELTNIQVDLLLKYIDDETEIILAFDKDVYLKDGIFDKELLQKTANRFTKNKVYCIVDKDNELSGVKDAPVDCGKETFENLLKNKKRLK